MDLNFSQRMKKTPVREVIQLDNIDEGLKTALWNYIEKYILNSYMNGRNRYNGDIISNASTDFFGHRYEEIDFENYWDYIEEFNAFFEGALWYQAYDFLEFMVNQKSNSSNAMAEVNVLLEKHMSGYRFVNGILSPIYENNELECIQSAIDTENNNVKVHLQTALAHLSDRESPDYRNSIKESITAVEAVCRKLTGKNTLGDALKALESTGVQLNSQFKRGIEKNYAYTNNSDTGIRHALIDDDKIKIEFEDAKFMLVLCSAFVNYISAKKKD